MPSAIQIRPEQVTDYGAIAQVHTAAFGQADEARLVGRLRQSTAYIADLSLVAVSDHLQVLGHILFSYATLTKPMAPEAPLRILVLAPLAVLPTYQRLSIGKQLGARGLTQTQALGNSLVTVLGHPSYYAQFGFTPASVYGIEHPFPVPGQAFMVKRLSPNSEIPPGKLCYAAAFDEIIEDRTPAEI